MSYIKKSIGEESILTYLCSFCGNTIGEVNQDDDIEQFLDCNIHVAHFAPLHEDYVIICNQCTHHAEERANDKFRPSTAECPECGATLYIWTQHLSYYDHELEQSVLTGTLTHIQCRSCTYADTT